MKGTNFIIYDNRHNTVFKRINNTSLCYVWGTYVKMKEVNIHIDMCSNRLSPCKYNKLIATLN